MWRQIVWNKIKDLNGLFFVIMIICKFFWRRGGKNMDEHQTKQFIVFAIAYGTNIMYILLIGILGGMNNSLDKDPVTAIIILLIGVVISIIASSYLVRQIDIEEIDKNRLVIKLGLAHIPALLALVGSVLYLYL